jgi:glycosyltransferase involved in cell wall biosynthesis
MTNFALVSVIIPCYNNEKTIIETLNSVFNQDYPSLEVIVVNDGSKDNSLKILNEFKESYKKENLHIIEQTNQGPSLTRNNGSNSASGKYLLFLDADDLIATSYITKCVKLLDKNPNLNIIYSDSTYFGAKKGKWKLPDFKLPDFLGQNCIPISSVIRREVFENVGKFDTNINYTEDWELWIRIVKSYGGVYKIPQALFFYRKRHDKSSLTDAKKNKDIKEKATLYIYNKHYTFYSENGYDIETLLKSKSSNEKYKRKYYSVWYRKLFY